MINYKKIENILKKNEFSFMHLKSTKSTMSDAKLNLEKFNENIFVLSNEQSEGRGRRGGTWLSPPGNIYCSIAYRNSFTFRQYFLFSMLTSLAVKDSLDISLNKKIMFKWPNDIFYENKKFGGIILETYSINNSNFVIIGLGLNFSSSPKIEELQTTHIKQFSQIDNIIYFLEIFLNNFFKKIDYYIKKNNNIIDDFKKSLMLLNNKIKIVVNEKEYLTGTFKDINDDGSLILENKNKLISIYSGRIEL